MEKFKNIVEKSEVFYMDWECACNLCEDEMSGHIHGPWVQAWMREHGWSQEDIDAREDFFLVRSMLKGLQDLARRGTHHDTNPTRRTPQGDEAQAADLWWNRYLMSADQAVRVRAERALRDAGARS